jgi:hypothetical protein
MKTLHYFRNCYHKKTQPHCTYFPKPYILKTNSEYRLFAAYVADQRTCQIGLFLIQLVEQPSLTLTFGRMLLSVY